MSNTPIQKVELLVHEMNYSGLPNLGVMLANALLEANIPVRLLVLGEEAPIPFAVNPKLEVKFFGIRRDKRILGKILYVLKVFFTLCIFFSRQRSKHVFMLGKEFMALAVILKVLFMLRFKIGGFNDSNISLNINYNYPYLLRWPLRFFFRSTLPSVDYLVSQSEGMTIDLVENYEVPFENISTISPIIDKKYFTNIKTENKKTGKIVFIGKLAEYKQPFKIIEIFQMLANKNTTLEFIGEGDLSESLHKKVEELGLADRIIFRGSQNDTISFLKTADVVILASKYEGLPMTLVEAIACGIPIVSFDCPTGPAEIIKDGINGYLIPQDNPEIFAAKLDKALVQDWDHEHIAQTAAKFHPDIVIKKYLDVIRKNMAEPAGTNN